MRNLHRHLEQRLAWYRRWHQSPGHQAVHYVLTGLFTVLMVAVIITFGHSHAASGTTYYVAANGSDANAGTSSTAPLQTLAKVSTLNLQPGDSVLFRKGDTFYGTLTVAKSGSSGAPITYGAYGSGAKPVITGFTAVSGWTSVGNGVYEATNSAFPSSMINMVAVNGQFQPIGRWPKATASNAGYLTIGSGSGSGSIVSSGLSGAPSFVGGEVVYRPVHWVLNRRTVSAQTASSVTFTQGSAQYLPTSGYGFFFQNSPAALSALGDWAYNASTKKLYMYFGSADPSSYAVQASTTDTLVSISSQNYVTFDGLAFTGSNTRTFSLASSSHITITNATIAFSGTNMLDVGSSASSNIAITNSAISYTNNNVIYGRRAANFTITNNTITNSGAVAGMGQSEDGQYFVTVDLGDGSVIQHNDIGYSGYAVIHFRGNNVVVANNYVHDFCLIKDDCGGISTYNDTNETFTGNKIIDNIIVNAPGAAAGTASGQSSGMGIYVDDDGNGIQISGNTVANMSALGFELHNAHEIQLTGNTTFNSGDFELGAWHDNNYAPLANITISNNIFFKKEKSVNGGGVIEYAPGVPTLGLTADNNVYANPIDDANSYLLGNSGTYAWMTLAQWKAWSGQDVNSSKGPMAISSTSDIFFDYNPSDAAKTDALSGSYVDARGTAYSACSVTIPAWGSIVLIKTGSTCSAAPAPAPVPAPDTTAPTVSITAPSAGSTVSGSVAVSANASDNVAVDHVDFYRGSTLISGDASAPYGATLDTTLLSNGSYTLTARAYDAAGNTAASGAVSITVKNAVVPPPDTAAPTVFLTAPAAGATVSATTTLTATATDDTGVSKVSFYRGSTLIDTDTTGSPYSVSWDTTGVSDGSYSITARATDAAGNAATSSPVSVTVKNAVPAPAPAVASAGPAAATFYQDCNYDTSQGGYVVSLPAGNYNLSDFAALGIRNDDISGVKLASGYQVTLYSDADYSGSSLTLSSDASCLLSNSFNDSVSSFKITAVSSTPTTPTPAPTATLAVGAKVVTTSSVTVRSTATVFARSTGSQKKGATGTITAGPTTSSGYTWWKVDFSSGADGWVPSKYLKVQ